MEKLDIRVKKLDERAILPVYGTAQSAGADLCALASEPIKIAPGETVLIHTGLALEICEGYGGFVFARSGLATKKGLAPANKVGVIDSDYRGEIMIPLHNSSSETAVILPGERVAQIVFLPYAAANFVETEALDEDTERGVGGFGSTGRRAAGIL